MGVLNPWLKEKLEKVGSPKMLSLIIEFPQGAEQDTIRQLQEIPGVSTGNIAFNMVNIKAPLGAIPHLEALPDIVIHYNMPVSVVAAPRIQDDLLGEISLSGITIPFSPQEMPTRIASLALRGILSRQFQDPSVIIVPMSEVRKELCLPENSFIEKTKVAVLDTGLSLPHPAFGLSAGLIKLGTTIAPWPVDGLGHGQWVATAAFGGEARTRFGDHWGVAEARAGRLGSWKVLSDIGFGSSFSVIKGIELAVRWGARVISMSLGGELQGSVDDDPQCRIIQRLKEQVIFVIACLEAHTKILTPSTRLPGYGKYRKYTSVRYLKPGGKIIAYDEKTNTFVEDTVVDIFNRKTREDLYEVKTDESHQVRVTGEHPFFVKRNGVLAWIAASNLRVGDHVYNYPGLPPEEIRPFRRGCVALLQVSCLECGMHFAAYKQSSNGARKFCSPECYRSYAVKHGLPKRGAIALRRYKKERPKDAYLSSLKGAISTRKKTGATLLELRLYAMLDLLGLTFRNEEPVYDKAGDFVAQVDALLARERVAIFVDGLYWHVDCQEKDLNIDARLSKEGWKVVRFSESEIVSSPIECMRIISDCCAVHADDPVITEINRISSTYNRTVFDIKTEKFHTLVANGLVVHNCGNDGGKGLWTIASPGASPAAVTVGAYSPVYCAVSIFSSRGPNGEFYKTRNAVWQRDLAKYREDLFKPDITAPGGGPAKEGQKVDLILSGVVGWTQPMYVVLPDVWGAMRGTSMATPIAAGVIALAVEHGLISTAADVKKKMARFGGKDINSGYGAISYEKLI